MGKVLPYGWPLIGSKPKRTQVRRIKPGDRHAIRNAINRIEDAIKLQLSVNKRILSTLRTARKALGRKPKV